MLLLKLFSMVATKLLGSDMTLTFPAQFDQATGSIALQAGAKIYNQKLKLSTSSGQQVEGYIISALEFAGDYLTYKNTVYGLMTFGYSNTYGTYAQLGKMKFPQNLGDYNVESLLIYFAKTENPSSSDEVLIRGRTVSSLRPQQQALPSQLSCCLWLQRQLQANHVSKA